MRSNEEYDMDLNEEDDMDSNEGHDEQGFAGWQLLLMAGATFGTIAALLTSFAGAVALMWIGANTLFGGGAC